MNVTSSFRKILRYLIPQRGSTQTIQQVLSVPTFRRGTSTAVYSEPTNNAEMIRRIMGWVFCCLSINGRAFASVPLRLYSTAPPRRLRAFRCRPADSFRIAELATRQDIHPQTQEMIERAVYDGQPVQEIVGAHPWNKLMRKPNPVLEFFGIMELSSMYQQAVGDAHWYVVNDGLGVPSQIWPLPSHQVEIIRGGPGEDPVKGWICRNNPRNFTFPQEAEQGLTLTVMQQPREELILPAKDVVHFRQVNPFDPYGRGMSAIRAGRLPMDLQVMMEDYQKQLLEGDGTPTWLLATKQRLPEGAAKEILDQWIQDRKTLGPGMPGILPDGLEPHVLGLTPREMAYVQGQDILLREIAAVLNVPIDFLDTKTSNKATIETADYFHKKGYIKPLRVQYDSEINRSIIWRYFGDEFFVASDDCVPEDAAALREELKAGLQCGWLKPDEARAKKRLPPTGEEGGDQCWMQAAMAPMAKLAKMEIATPHPQNTPKPDKLENADHPRFELRNAEDDLYWPTPEFVTAVRGYFTDQRDRILDNLKRRGRVATEDDNPFGQEADQRLDAVAIAFLLAALRRGARNGLAKVMEKTGRPIIGFNLDDPNTQALLADYRSRLINQIWSNVNRAMQKRIAIVVAEAGMEGIPDAVLAERIKAALDGSVDQQAMAVARSENARAEALGNDLAYMASGVAVVGKRLIVAPPTGPNAPCEICVAVQRNHPTAPIGGTFGGYDIPFHNHCRCWTAPILRVEI